MFPGYAKRLDNNRLDVEQKLLLTKSNLTVELDKCTGCGVCIDACPEEAITRGAVGASGRGKAKVAKIDVDEKKCSFCGVCNIMCPFDAIKLTVDGQPKLPIIEQQGFPVLEKKAKIDPEKCTHCVLCEEVCPRDAIKREVADVDQGHKASSTMKYSIDYKLDEDKCTLCGICAEACDAFKIDYKEPTPLTVKKIGKLNFDEKKCDACKVCVEICPEDALQIERKILEEPKLKGKVDIDLEKCTTCSWCQVICPQEAAKVEKLFEGELTINTDKCPAGCSTCVEICPCNALYLPLVEEAGQKPGKLSYNKDFCMYCGACVTACPADGTITLKRSKVNVTGEKTNLFNKIEAKLLEEKTPKIQGA
ncbi:tungsten-containing formylmethanofuran dehydrogenase subunit F [Methanocella paludicola SANAE]|uniref:Tungsten-containing formylmethanofuran dehydrogenase subunit F n=1 Tax=Methanocella paludicola (strain DSM 17711 / JCM 13418 / NBRC 101707 / SANAE) TaxID=304371 RepID=D1YYX9_METPS|nr:4Fe-4S binding protein [Methanocella paludicola]BAI61651.1 tungsten-containing formylmethanofuran dehydrogenase subunit F [Methanocella paludicola SANAE]